MLFLELGSSYTVMSTYSSHMGLFMSMLKTKMARDLPAESCLLWGILSSPDTGSRATG